MLAVIPAFLVALTFTVIGESVTEIAFHWDANGRVDGTIPALPVYVTAQVLAIVGVGFSSKALLQYQLDRGVRRSVLFWCGTAAGVAMAIWVVPAWLTAAAGGARQAELGGWLVLMVAFLLYGVLLRAVVPHPDALSR